MSNIRHLLKAYAEAPTVRALAEALYPKKSPSENPGAARVQLSGLIGAQNAFVIAGAAVRLPALPQVVIAASKEDAAYLHNDLEGILAPEREVLFFPDSFKRPAFFDDLNPTQMLQRSETVSKIAGGGAPAQVLEGERPRGGFVAVTYPEAIFEKVVRPEILFKNRIEVVKGARLDLDFIMEVLLEYGFGRADFVYEPGQFSLRGGIVDLFSYGNEWPYRIELFDDEVESIRTFDPLTQLSRQNLSKLSIVPNLNTRFRQEEKTAFTQVLPPETIIWVQDFQNLTDRLRYCFDSAEKFALKLSALDSAELREIFRDRAFLFPGEVVGDLVARPIVFMKEHLDVLQKNHPELFRA